MAQALGNQPPPVEIRYQQEEPIPLYGVPQHYLAQGEERKEHTFTAYVKELNSLLPKFGGLEHENVDKFIMCVDQGMVNCKMTSKQVMTALRSANSPIYDRAIQFLNLTLNNPKYPHSDHWCEQRFRPGRAWIPWRPAVEEQAAEPSIPELESLPDSIATGDSIVTIPPPAPNAVLGVHGDARHNDPRTMRQHARHHQDHVPHQDHIPYQPEIPDQTPIAQFDEILPKQCFRHYLYHEFKRETNIATATKALAAAQHQTRSMTVREFIWKLQLAHREYKKARWGFRAVEMTERNREADEDSMCNAIQNNTVNEFKKFIESKITSDKKCMDTISKCEEMARIFEELTQEGQAFTAKCRSNAKVEQVMALTVQSQDSLATAPRPINEMGAPPSSTYNPAYFSTPQNQFTMLQQNLQQMQQDLNQMQQTSTRLQWQNQSQFQTPPPVQTPPMPDHLLGSMSDDQWQAAYTTAASQVQQVSAANLGNMQSRNPPRGRGMGGISRRPGNRGRGGLRGNRGRGAANRGGSQQTQPPRPPPPPNVIPVNYSEYWATNQQQEQGCLHPNPQGLPRCGYCGVAGHGYSQCGYKREDTAQGKTWNIHPKRGQLLSKKRTYAQYMRAQRQNVANSAATVTFTDFTSQGQDSQHQQQQQRPPLQQPPTNAASAPNSMVDMQQQIATMAASLATMQQQQHNVSSVMAYGLREPPKAIMPKTMPPLLPPLPLTQSNSTTTMSTYKDQTRQHTTQFQGGAFPHPPRPPNTQEEQQEHEHQLQVLPPSMTPQEVQYYFQSWADQQAAQRLQLQNHGQEPKEEEDFYH